MVVLHIWPVKQKFQLKWIFKHYDSYINIYVHIYVYLIIQYTHLFYVFHFNVNYMYREFWLVNTCVVIFFSNSFLLTFCKEFNLVFRETTIFFFCPHILSFKDQLKQVWGQTLLVLIQHADQHVTADVGRCAKGTFWLPGSREPWNTLPKEQSLFVNEWRVSYMSFA